MADWVGATFTSTTGWDHLETLVDIGDRMAGSDGERRGAEATRDALAVVGARDARLHPFDVQGWERESAHVSAGGADQSAIALPRSPAGAVTGPLVDVGHGLPADFDRDLTGAVVMVATDVPDWHDRFIHRREKYYRAVEAGAAAFVFRNHVEGCLPPTGSVGRADAPIGEIPAVGVSKEVGDRLQRRWADTEVTVGVSATIGEATSQNVHADLGPDTDEAVLVTSHVDAHDIAEGAADNGVGTALVLEVAKALAMREDDLETRVECVCFGAEEVGLEGSSYEASRRDADTVKVVVNNDGVGRARTLRAITNGFDALGDALAAPRERLGHPIGHSPRLSTHSDHWPFVQRGIPGYHNMAETPYEGRGWGHTAADTLDKLDVRDLREQAAVVTELVAHLASDAVSFPRRDRSSIADQLEVEHQAEGMRLIGDWPY